MRTIFARVLSLLLAAGLLGAGCRSSPEPRGPALLRSGVGESIAKLWSAAGGVDRLDRIQSMRFRYEIAMGDEWPASPDRPRILGPWMLRVAPGNPGSVESIEGPNVSDGLEPAARELAEALIASLPRRIGFPLPVLHGAWEFQRHLITLAPPEERTGFWAVPEDDPLLGAMFVALNDGAAGVETLVYEFSHGPLAGRVFRATPEGRVESSGIRLPSTVTHRDHSPRRQATASAEPRYPWEARPAPAVARDPGAFAFRERFSDVDVEFVDPGLPLGETPPPLSSP